MIKMYFFKIEKTYYKILGMSNYPYSTQTFILLKYNLFTKNEKFFNKNKKQNSVRLCKVRTMYALVGTRALKIRWIFVNYFRILFQIYVNVLFKKGYGNVNINCITFVYCISYLKNAFSLTVLTLNTLIFWQYYFI